MGEWQDSTYAMIPMILIPGSLAALFTVSDLVVG